jgi:hypothetical protein
MKRYVWPALVFAFPFVYFFRFVYPDTSLLVLGNDFGWLYYVYKGYLADSVAHGHFPLWSPAEAGGYAFFGNPFAAALYPLNLLPIALRLLVGNYNYWFHQIYTVLGVSVFALGLYRWLQRVFGNPAAALFASVTLSACWSMGEFMRFPNAIHTMAWVPWVLAALHAAHHSSHIRPVLGGVAALLCEITAGYPYFVVYSCFLYGAYALDLHWTGPRPGWQRRAARQLGILLVPPLVTFPYTYTVSELMRVTTDRAGGQFGFASDYRFGPLDLLGSLVFPPVSTTEGCFYGGTLTVFLLVLYFWRHRDSHEKVGVLVAWMGFLAITMNYRSYLFTPLWSLIPVVNQMRAFSRMTIVLLPVLAIAIHQGFVLLSAELAKGAQARDLSPRFVWLVFGAILTLQVGLYSVKNSFNEDYTTMQAVNFPNGSHEIDFLMYTVLTLGVVLFVLSVDWAKFAHGREIALGILLVLVTQDAGTQGRLLWATPLAAVLGENGIDPSERPLEQAWALAKRKANFWRLIRDYFSLDRSSDMQSLAAEGLTKVPMQNFDYRAYTLFYWRAQGDKAEFDRLMGQQKLYFHAALHEHVSDFLGDADNSAARASAPAVLYFDGNELRVEITNAEPGYLSWIDNFDLGWSGELDGARVPIERVMGTFKAIRLQAPGTHHLRFVYRPLIPAGAYAAMGAGVVGLGLLAWWSRRRRRVQVSDAACGSEALPAGPGTAS